MTSAQRFRLALSALCLVFLTIPGRAQTTGRQPSVSKEAQADLDAMNAKLNGIILPEVKFDKTPLPEAIAQLRVAAHDNDKTADAAQRGINIFVKLKGAAGTPTTPITLDLKSVPLKDALEAVSKQAGLSMKVERYAVIFGL